MRELIPVRNHMNAMYVAKPSIEAITLDCIRESTLERNHINVLYAGKPSVNILTLDNTRKYM